MRTLLVVMVLIPVWEKAYSRPLVVKQMECSILEKT